MEGRPALALLWLATFVTEAELTVSDTQFSRIDWRPGARRKTVPRVRSYGGQKEAPLWLLAAGRFVGLHTNRAARCTATALSTGRKWRRVAVTGRTSAWFTAERSP